MIDRVNQLETFQRAYGAAMELYRTSCGWPNGERYALTDQIRRSSRAVCANLAEADLTTTCRRVIGGLIKMMRQPGKGCGPDRS